MATLDPRVKIYKNGTWQTPDVPKRYTGGSWQDLQSMKVYFNGQWNELIQSTPTAAYYPLYCYMHEAAVSPTIPGKAHQNMVTENDDGSITVVNTLTVQTPGEEVNSRAAYPTNVSNIWQYSTYYQSLGCTHRTCFVFCPSSLDDITITNTGNEDAGVGIVHNGVLTQYDPYTQGSDTYAYDAREISAGNSLTIQLVNDPSDYKILIFIDNAFSGNSVKISIPGKKILCPIRYARKGNNALYVIDNNGVCTQTFTGDGSYYSFDMETSPAGSDSIFENYGYNLSIFNAKPFMTILARDPSRYKLVSYCNDQYNGYQIYYPDTPVYYDDNLNVNYNDPQRYAAAAKQVLESKTRDASGYTVETIGFGILRALSSLERCYFKLYDTVTNQYIPDSLFNVLQADYFSN